MCYSRSVPSNLPSATLSTFIHAIKDHRLKKAHKIERLLLQHCSLSNANVLDVGTGAGYISSHLCKQVKSLESVDVVDARVVHDFSFTLFDGAGLPFSDEQFDVVISNQVYEHVTNQRGH